PLVQRLAIHGLGGFSLGMTLREAQAQCTQVGGQPWAPRLTCRGPTSLRVLGEQVSASAVFGAWSGGRATAVHVSIPTSSASQAMAFSRLRQRLDEGLGPPTHSVSTPAKALTRWYLPDQDFTVIVLALGPTRRRTVISVCQGQCSGLPI